MNSRIIRSVILALFIIFTASICWAYTHVLVIGKTPFAFERVTVTTAAVSRLNATHRNIAGAVFITVEGNNIRYKIVGGDPSIVNGHLVIAASYQNIWLTDPSSIRNFRMIAIGGNAIVSITYYRKN